MIYGIDRAFDEEHRKGEKKEKFKIAEKLLKKGTSIQEIIELTELSEKEIQEIQKALEK